MGVEKIRIVGGKPLRGQLNIYGGKNAALAVIPAALLTNDVCVIENVPNMDDIVIVQQMLRELGATVELTDNVMTICCAGVRDGQPDPDLAQQLRGSFYFLGALLGRRGYATVAMPGGCKIGERKIDQHVKGFEAMGAQVVEDPENQRVHAKADRLLGTEIYLDMPSVGATVNLLLAAATAQGNTEIHNAAKEPHIVDLANMLNSMGARIRGAGTGDIRIRGVEKLHGTTYSIIPDQIETGTFMIAAAATCGDVIIRGAIPVHLEALTAKLMEMGVRVSEGDDQIRVTAQGPLRAISVQTLPYPGFPTDLQQPLSALLTTAKGVSEINETIFDNRHNHIHELVRMGADATVNGRIATIRGVKELHGAEVVATDLRAGAAMVIAALMAHGVTLIGNVHYIDRGYEHFEEKLRALGADICRVVV